VLAAPPSSGVIYDLGGWVWFDANFVLFFFFHFLLFPPWIACWPCKKLYQPFNFFYFDLFILLLIAIVLFTLIISNWILFLILSLVV
jgi:hypothetical protein